MAAQADRLTVPASCRTRSLTPVLLALAAFVTGLVAQGYLVPWGGLSPARSPTDGLLIYAVASLLFVRAVQLAPEETLFRPPEHFLITVPERGWRGGVAILFILASGAATFLSLRLFAHDLPGNLKWVIHLCAIWGFLTAVHFLSSTFATTAPVANGGRRWGELAVLGLIVGIGAFFRFYRFADLPYGLWYDEADNGLWAREILRNPDFRPIYVPSTNLPAHFLYLVALSFRIFGDSMHAIRAVAAILGMLTILAAYACGRELFRDRKLALIAAFLLAVSRWDVNWSRIGMHGVTVPLFELWTVAALLRGLRTGRLAPFAWAGVATGLGLCFYSPFRIFPVILGGFALAWLTRRLSGLPRGAIWSGLHKLYAGWGLHLLLFTLGALTVAAPVVQFAIRNPDVFWDRARRVSIFKDPEVRDHPLMPILKSTAQHLLMFNHRGDPNGRHNLPGAPMLDRLSGVLLVLGVSLCLVRRREPRAVLLLLWLLVPLIGGILSVRFEAPQSLRSIGSLPAAYLIACLPLGWLAGVWEHTFAPTRAKLGTCLRHPLALPTMLLLATIGADNALAYFGLWAHDFASWAAFNPAETRMARDIARYRDDYDLLFDPLVTAHLTTRYLLPDYNAYQNFDPATVFPIRGTSRRGVLLFIAPDTYVVREQAEALYPGVRVDHFFHPDSGNTVLYKYFFPRRLITSRQGLLAAYRPLPPDESEEKREIVSLPDVKWDNTPPLQYPFLAVWRGGLLAPGYGPYTLRVEAPGDFTLTLDGTELLRGFRQGEREVMMAWGVHALRLEARVSGPGQIRLMWITPNSPEMHVVPGDALYRPDWPTNGLLGRFYHNATWSGEPTLARIDRQVAYYFHFLPLPRPYTVEWTGRLVAPVAGKYQLGLRVTGKAWLYVDGRPLLEEVEEPFQAADVELSKGEHRLTIRYLDDRDHSQIYLYWQPPGGPMSLIPYQALLLPKEGGWWLGRQVGR